MRWLISTTTFLVLGVISIISPDVEFTLSNTLIVMGLILIAGSVYDWYKDQQAETAAENAGN